jgi:glycosyltransferase involved in cell wall biosynthesis
MKIRTLMLGWEFPPFISGGLGTACHGLTRAMGRAGMEVTFLLPRMNPIRFVAGDPRMAPEPVECAFANVRLRPISSGLSAYGRYGPTPAARRVTAAVEAELLEGMPEGATPYGPDIHEEVRRYAIKVLKTAQSEEFHVIHAHDWMTFPAGIALAASTGKPLIVQVHSTEFDRSGEHVNQFVYDIERQGMHAAARVIAVSNYTRNIIVHRYAVPATKIDVVYNGVEFSDAVEAQPQLPQTATRDKVVLFLGRITMQKGPEYFLRAAKRVLEKIENVKFIMAGDGDRLYGTIEQAAWLGIGHKVFFTRFLRGPDVDRAYRMADLYVMPSVSEPFGIAPLEALQHNVPVLISRQSGIAETFRNALKVDFWDIDEMANKMVAVLRYAPLQEMLRANGRREARKFRWEDSAAKVNEIYHRVLNVA